MVAMRELSRSLILMPFLHQVQPMVLGSPLFNLLLPLVLQCCQYNLCFATLFLSYGEDHGAQEESFGHVVPQFCNWVELFQCVGLEMVVWVVEWVCIFEMDADGVMVGQVVE